MVCEVENEVVKTLKPLIDWITIRGADFAVNLIAAAVIMIVGILAIKGLSAVMNKFIASKKLGQRETLVRFGASVLVKIAWAMLAVTVLGKLGVNVGPLVAGIGVTGFVVGFAFQESLASLSAGFMLAINAPFKVGDYVKIADFEGRVVHLDMMTVILHTADNRRITIPNKQVWGAPIVNYSSLELRRVDVSVGVAYGSDIDFCRSVAVKALSAIAAVLPDPAPMSEVVAFQDSAVLLTCRAWVKNADYWNVFFEANRNVKEAFDREGISIPFPQVDVHIQESK